MRAALLATAMLCAAVNAAAQSHEPAAKPAAKADAPAAAHGEPAAAQGEPAAAKPVAVKLPLVSRITAAPKPTVHADSADANGTDDATKKPRVLVSGATAATRGRSVTVSGAAPPAATHGAENAPAASPAAPVTTVNPRAPVRLETVHGRIAAALAGLRAESKAGKADADAHDGASPSGAASRAHRETAPPMPRVVVTWPEVRWRVIWRDDPDRVAVAWPE